jgi:hypothetical protein
MIRWSAAVIALALVAGAEYGQAQSESRLTAIVRLAQDGLADSARAEMRRVLATLPPGDSLYPEALYTSALIAANDQERRLALRKVMIEHSRSAWVDDAILLMGQLEYAAGNPDGTVAQIVKLIEDYPLSPLRAVGAFWGARAAADLGRADLACRWADIGREAPADDVELRNRLDYQRQRCAGMLAQRADSIRRAESVTPSVPPPPPPPPTPPAAPARATGFFVQVAAAPSDSAANVEAEALRRLDLAVVVVQEGGFHKVRAGPFTTRARAEAALSRIRARRGGRPFVVTVR